MTILLGIVGAVLGGVIAHATGLGAGLTFVIAVAVAAILVAIVTPSRSRLTR